MLWDNILKMTTQSPVLLWGCFTVSPTQEDLFLCLTSALQNLPLSDAAAGSHNPVMEIALHFHGNKPPCQNTGLLLQ